MPKALDFPVKDLILLYNSMMEIRFWAGFSEKTVMLNDWLTDIISYSTKPLQSNFNLKITK